MLPERLLCGSSLCGSLCAALPGEWRTAVSAQGLLFPPLERGMASQMRVYNTGVLDDLVEHAAEEKRKSDASRSASQMSSGEPPGMSTTSFLLIVMGVVLAWGRWLGGSARIRLYGRSPLWFVAGLRYLLAGWGTLSIGGGMAMLLLTSTGGSNRCCCCLATGQLCGTRSGKT